MHDSNGVYCKTIRLRYAVLALYMVNVRCVVQSVFETCEQPDCRRPRNVRQCSTGPTVTVLHAIITSPPGRARIIAMSRPKSGSY